MLIAHLSDPHITTGPLAAAPAVGLQRALGRVLALDPQPDCVVITGDLVDRGSPAEYAELSAVIGTFPLPLHLVTGNHDSPSALVDAFAGSALLGGGLHAHYAVEYPEVTIVALDSNIPDSAAGRLGPDQLRWLDEVLLRRPDVPAFVALHHPPVPVGVPAMDDIRLEDGAQLAAVISSHSNVIRVLAGHLHRVAVTPFAGALLTVAPSTYRQTSLTMLADRPFGYLYEPTGFLLHLLTDHDCVTHSVAISHAAEVSADY